MQRQRTRVHVRMHRAEMHTCVLAARAASAVFGHDLGSGASPPYLGDTQMKRGARGNTLGITSNENYILSNRKTLPKQIATATLFHPPSTAVSCSIKRV